MTSNSDSHSILTRSNAIVAESSNLSIAGQIIVFTLLAMLLVVLAGGFYHLCTRVNDTDDIENTFPMACSTEDIKEAEPIKGGRTPVELEKNDQEEEEKEGTKGTSGACLPYTTSLLPIQPVPDDSSSTLHSFHSAHSSASLLSSNAWLFDADLLPTITLQPSEDVDRNSNLFNFPPSLSTLLLSARTLNNARVLPADVYLKIPTMSWTGRIMEIGEPVLPSSCSLEYSDTSLDSDISSTSSATSSAYMDSDDSNDSVSFICDLIRPATPTPPTGAVPHNPFSMTLETPLATSFSLDLDSVLLVASKFIGQRDEPSSGVKDTWEDEGESEGDVYTGIVNDKMQRHASVLVLPVVDTP
ncbi:unnamed protein product [Somion occarium]|uniref:Transmembrane protein n=1 Tax=Somion occarium TaxID=3059160 RepID=A0ABP1DI81_9APHY